MRMDCPSCGAENRAGRKFCAECGTPLALACPACGREFAIFVPASLAAVDVNQVYGELTELVTTTCGDHPPVIQRQ